MNLIMMLTPITSGALTMLMRIGRLTLTVTGHTQTADGCGSHITSGAGEHTTTEDGGGLRAGDGSGHPAIYGRLHRSFGCIGAIIADCIRFHQEQDGTIITTATAPTICVTG